jgi:hypothetical protein
MANRHWVGGTGTWDAADTTHWAATAGGAGGQSVPGTGDAVILDASSGGGTVTVNTTVAVQTLTMGAFTGTLDFSANNNNVTLSGNGGFSGTGSGARTLNLGNGTWTLTGVGGATLWNMATVTNLTFNANSSTIVFTTASSAVKVFSGGGLTYNAISIGADTSRGGFQFQGANTIATLTVGAPNTVEFTASTTTTITNAFAFVGTRTLPIALMSTNPNIAATVSISSGSASLSAGAIRSMTFSGGATFSATESYDLGATSGITITGPSSGVIGG